MISKCPRCGKSPLGALTISNVELDRCGECKGLWMDGGEYEKVIESARTVPSAQLPPLSPPKMIRLESYRPLRVQCPSCGKSTLEPEPVRFDFIHRMVVMDRCPNCNGVWLDGSELALLLDYLKREDWFVSEIAERELKAVREEHAFWRKSKFFKVLRQIYEFV